MDRWLIGTGALLILAGAVWRYAPWAIAWFGRLPGDLRFESDRTVVFIPITSMLIISVALTVLARLLQR